MDRHDAAPDPQVRGRSLAALREAVAASRPDAPRYAVYLGNLASGYFTLGLEDGSPPTSPAALTRARELLREAAGQHVRRRTAPYLGRVHLGEAGVPVRRSGRGNRGLRRRRDADRLADRAETEPP